MDEESLAVVTEGAGGSRAALVAAAARARRDPGSCAVVLVEGMSDQAALETLAGRLGRNLREEGVFIVPMGGATNIGHFLGLFGPRGFGVRLAGLCDQGEEHDFCRRLEQAGLGAGLDRAGLARLGFFVAVFPARPHAPAIGGPGLTPGRLMTWPVRRNRHPRLFCWRMSHYAGQLLVHLPFSSIKAGGRGPRRHRPGRLGFRRNRPN